MTDKTTDKRTISDLRRETDKIMEGIVGKSKTLEKVIKVRRLSFLETENGLRRQKENQRD